MVSEWQSLTHVLLLLTSTLGYGVPERVVLCPELCRPCVCSLQVYSTGATCADTIAGDAGTTPVTCTTGSLYENAQAISVEDKSVSEARSLCCFTVSATNTATYCQLSSMTFLGRSCKFSIPSFCMPYYTGKMCLEPGVSSHTGLTLTVDYVQHQSLHC
jgi:hypothetical protein